MIAAGTLEAAAAGVAEVRRFGPAGAPARLLLEVPHGATARRHLDELAARLRGALPEGLEAYFHVNTDEGAPELAEAVASRLGGRRPGILIRSTLPRTLVDCNRVVRGAVASGMTAGIPDYVRDPGDRELLLGLHARYAALAEAAYAEVCAEGAGLAVALHTYAPRSIDVPVDDRIVDSLRREYRAGALERWPLRPEIDLIAATAEGESWVPEGWLERARATFGADGFEVAVDATYSLHPATLAHRFSVAYPGRVVCLEVRRDLLGDPWEPFTESRIGGARFDRVADALARAIDRQLAAA